MSIDLRPDSLDQLRDYLDLVTLRVTRYVALHGHRLLHADGRLSDLQVSMREAHALSRATNLFPRDEPFPTAQGWPSSEEIEGELDQFAHGVARRWRDTEEPERLALTRVRRIFGLDEVQLQLLVAAAAPLISIDLARFYSFAWAGFSNERPTVGFLAELMADAPHRVHELVGQFAADAPLVRHGLVRLGDRPGWRGTDAMLPCAVTVPEQIVAFLVGRRYDLPSDIADACSPEDSSSDSDGTHEMVAPERVLQTLRGVLRANVTQPDRVRLLLTGGRGVGRRTSVARTLRRTPGMSDKLLTVDLARLAERPERFADALATLATEALLRDATLLLRANDLPGELSAAATESLGATPDERALATVGRALSRQLASFRGRLVVTAAPEHRGLLRYLSESAEFLSLTIPNPDAAQQLALWQRALQATGAPFSPTLAPQLARRFDQTPGIIFRSAQRAVRRVGLAGSTQGIYGPDGADPVTGERPALSLEVLADAVQAVGRVRRLGDIAESMTTSLGWDDAVLDEDVRGVLEEILWHAQHRQTLMDDWGFRHKMSYGRGLSCLFFGPPGTGKTMMAAILARSLRKPLYRIDLSRIASKGVGETEKNLARLFDQAEKSGVVLLFDKADSLFSRRTNASDAADRSARARIGYLLQRMESYDGMTVLTSNLESSIDDAFKRRMRYRVRFPMPSPEQRELLWSSMLPERAPVADDIDFSALADSFPFSGGVIENAVLRGAVFAAHEGCPIGYQHLHEAGIQQARDLGIEVRGEARESGASWLPIVTG